MCDCHTLSVTFKYYKHVFHIISHYFSVKPIFGTGFHGHKSINTNLISCTMTIYRLKIAQSREQDTYRNMCWVYFRTFRQLMHSQRCLCGFFYYHFCFVSGVFFVCRVLRMSCLDYNVEVIIKYMLYHRSIESPN